MIYWVTYPGTPVHDILDHLRLNYTGLNDVDYECINKMPYAVDLCTEDRTIFILADGQHCIRRIAQEKNIESQQEYHQDLIDIIQARQGEYYSGWGDYSIAWCRQADLVLRLEDYYNDPSLWINQLSSFLENVDFTVTPAKNISKKNATGQWPENINNFYSARFGFVADTLGYRTSGTVDHLVWSDSMDNLRKNRQVQDKILVDIDKLADARYDGVRRYVKNIAVEFQKMAWQGLLPIQIDVFLKKKLMPLDAHTPIYDYHLDYESQLLGVKEKIKNTLPGPLYRLGRSLYLGIQIRKILAWFRDTIVERRWWMFTDESGKSLKDQLSEYKLIHCTLPQHFVYFKDLQVEKLVTLHDMTHEALPELHREENLKWARLGHKDLSQKGAHLISVSENTRSDFQRTYPEHKGEHRVIYEGVDLEQFGPQFDTGRSRNVLTKFKVKKRNYFFTLFTLEPRKNLDTVVQSFIQFKEHSNEDVVLLVGGQTGWKFDSSIYNHPSIHFTGYIEEEDLPVLYGNARGFFYLSQYEGFGLPPLEAMVCGAPVVYGDNSSMRELYGDAGIGIQAFDQEACIQSMIDLLDDEYVERQKTEGFRQALRYNWGDAARSTISYYMELVEAQN